MKKSVIIISLIINIQLAFSQINFVELAESKNSEKINQFKKTIFSDWEYNWTLVSVVRENVDEFVDGFTLKWEKNKTIRTDYFDIYGNFYRSFQYKTKQDKYFFGEVIYKNNQVDYIDYAIYSINDSIFNTTLNEWQKKHLYDEIEKY